MIQYAADRTPLVIKYTSRDEPPLPCIATGRIVSMEARHVRVQAGRDSASTVPLAAITDVRVQAVSREGGGEAA